MGNGVRRGSPEDLRQQAKEEAYIGDQALKRELQELLLLALAKGGDAPGLLQRAVGPDLRRLGVLHGPLRFLTTTGEPVAVPDDPPQVRPEEPDPHARSNAELLRMVHARLVEERSVTQPERAELARLAGLILSRLGGLIGR